LAGILFNKSQTTLIQYPCGKAGGYTIPNGVTNIGDGAFQYCTRLVRITIPSSVTDIGDNAFIGCSSLSAITVDALNSTYTGVAGVLFNEAQTTLIQYPPASAATSYTIPNSVTNIGDRAFQYSTSLISVTIPSSVSSIGNYAFSGCSSLTSVTIPASVRSIGWDAFGFCTSLNAVYFRSNTPSIVSTLFDFDNFATVYYLPGTTGWDLTFGGRPAVLWNPQVQTSGASFGVQTNRFGFTITGTTDIPIVVEACTDLASASWISLQTCTLTNGSIYFSDPQWTNYPCRCYRLRSP
jgi:hypothetical protein